MSEEGDLFVFGARSDESSVNVYRQKRDRRAPAMSRVSP